MSRPSDTVRGARLAQEIADANRQNLVLFETDISPDFWDTIHARAQEVIDEHAALVAAPRAGE